MIYEVREYVPMPGRLGDVVSLFQSTVIPLFRTHQMEIVQAGTTTVGDNSFNELVYAMRFSSMAELDQKWNVFLSDPEWSAALAHWEADGPLYRSIRRRIVDSTPFEALLDGPQHAHHDMKVSKT